MPDGQWAMVYVAVRPRGFTPNYHVNGREVFVAGIDWVDDWPVVIEDRFVGPDGPVTVDRFDGRYLSTEVAGGFTGRVVGIRSIAGAVRLREFRYLAGP